MEWKRYVCQENGKATMSNSAENGKKLIVTFENVKFVPNLRVNMFIISKALKNRLNLDENGEMIKLIKGKDMTLDL